MYYLCIGLLLSFSCILSNLILQQTKWKLNNIHIAFIIFLVLCLNHYYTHTFCSLIFEIVFSFIVCLSFKYLVLKCCMHLLFLFHVFIFQMCICSISKVLAFSVGSVFGCFNTTIDFFCCPHL